MHRFPERAKLTAAETVATNPLQRPVAATTVKASRVETKENLVSQMSGAKEKLSKTTAYKMMHPFSNEARDQATEKAKTVKQDIQQNQANIRSAAHHQAEEEIIRNTNPMRVPESPLTAQPEKVQDWNDDHGRE
ncbi:hypothetical protein R1sor_026537 [Riccia sorocarpa]|uniref:Uncharacterized protein n=1 Tax=Riccia sorocarpa TaxID=122646 RepID=A0ABD3GDR0_9MARC